MARRLLSNTPTKLGFNLLKKAEKEALNYHRYSLLNDVYKAAIEYSFHPLSDDQEKLFTKAEQNKRRIEHEEVLNQLYAKIKKAFYQAEYNQETIDFEQLVTDPMEELQSIYPEIEMTFESLFKIVQMFDYYAAHMRNYHNIDSIVEEQWERTEKVHTSNTYDNYYKVETIYTLANIHFRKKEFKKSLYYLDLLEKELASQKEGQKEKYEVRHETLRALNLHFINSSTVADQLLETLINKAKHKKKELYSAILTKAMIAFHREDYKTTSGLLAQLNFSDAWYEKTVGIDWNLHKKYMEILLHIELGNLDLTESRISSLKRKYKKQLSGDRNSQVLPFLALIETYIKKPDSVHSDNFRYKLENSMQWKRSEEEDLFFMCFYAWLKSKMDKTPIYETTLELIHSNNGINYDLISD